MEEHGSGIVAAVASLLAAIGFPGFLVWLVRRGSADKELVEVLRKALDKGRVRENAYCGALDALIAGIDHLPDPPPALRSARARALERMEAAHCQLINGGGK
jgi:hypothetical protein